MTFFFPLLLAWLSPEHLWSIIQGANTELKYDDISRGSLEQEKFLNVLSLQIGWVIEKFGVTTCFFPQWECITVCHAKSLQSFLTLCDSCVCVCVC